MSYLVLARKWRPQRFEDLVGQEHVARTLANAIERGRVAHAFLFTGVRGVGKTTSARILAKTLNCMGKPGGVPLSSPPLTPCLECPACQEIAAGTDLDVREIDGASYNGVDEVRKLQDSIPYRPARDRYKIIIVDEVHMLSVNAWNAFLKTLEEPPPHVKFIFATTEVHKVPITILSRVQRFDFKLIGAAQIARRLREVLAAEGIGADDAAVSLLAREAAGSMRDAMSLLDQVIAWSESGLVGSEVARVLGVASHAALIEIARALVRGEAAECLRCVAALAAEGQDLTHVARDLLAVLRDLSVARLCEAADDLIELPEDARRALVELSKATEADDWLRLHQGFSQGYDDVQRSGQPRAALEMLLLRLARRPPLIPLDDLVGRLGALERSLRGAPGAPSRARAPEPAAPERPRARDPRPSPPRDRPTGDPRDEPPPSPPPREDAGLAEGPADDPHDEPLASRRSNPEPPRPAPESPRSVPESLRPPPSRQARTEDEQRRFDTWSAVVDRVAQDDARLAAFLRHAVPLELGPEAIVIAWEQSGVHVAEGASRAATDAVASAARALGLGSPVVMQRSDFRFDGPLDSVSNAAARERAERERALRERALSHPALLEAIEVFGARVKELKLPDLD